MNNWKMNQRRAAAALGLSTVEQKNEHGQVRQLDIELDDGSRAVLTVTRRGSLSVQVYKDSSRGRPLWALSGAATIGADVVREWADTLHEKTRETPRQKIRPKLDLMLSPKKPISAISVPHKYPETHEM
jgi:hypothetical protein